ncbi:MAG TPA: LodA/GoxA family CTQ-dependent oxidase [Candidatus Angelobacter sp.]|nr:LodA/GoxA family CTQ-dependent oxidase [Candidatus Angelobacter sp.]
MTYKIHPAIGVARLGNSQEFYLEPRVAGQLPVMPDGKPFKPSDFRDRDKKMRRQGAQFEVFKYDDNGTSTVGVPVRPGQDGVERIEWTVHLANKKAVWYKFLVNLGEYGYVSGHPFRNSVIKDPAERAKFIIDPGPRTLTGPNKAVEFSRTDNPQNYPMTFPPTGLQPFSIDSLGGLRTDAQSRLVVLGGYGNSGTSKPVVECDDYANNDEWWDDMSDGPVTTKIVMRDGSVIEAFSAWVITGPARFAPQLVNLITLYDVMFDVAVRSMAYRPDIYKDCLWNSDYRPGWNRDIRPILERAHLYPWVSDIPTSFHTFDYAVLGNPDPQYDDQRELVLNVLRPPFMPNVRQYTPIKGPAMTLMPVLWGDNLFTTIGQLDQYVTLTDTQYFFMMQWAAGKFVVDSPAAASPGDALDRAALENCSGAAFDPGMELTWITRNPRIYSEPFRIHRKLNVGVPLNIGTDFAQGLEPGDLSKYMALPWQADYNQCSQFTYENDTSWWWPVQRPDTIHLTADEQAGWVGPGDNLTFDTNLEMVEKWTGLGFIFNEGTVEKPTYVQVERTLPPQVQTTTTTGASAPTQASPAQPGPTGKPATTGNK